MQGLDVERNRSVRNRLEYASAVLGVFVTSLVAGGPLIGTAEAKQVESRVASVQEASRHRGESHIGSAVSGVFSTYDGTTVGIYDARRIRR